MGNITNTTTAASAVAEYYEKKFLLESKKTFVAEPLGMQGRIPKGRGNTVVWNRWTLPAAQTTALTEATDPAGTSLSAALVSATLNQYGDFTRVSDIVDLTAVDSAVEKAIDLMAYEAALSIDTVVQAEISANGTVQYANTAVARNSLRPTDTYSVTELRKGIKKLHNFAARPHTNNKYVAMTHPDVIFDLQGDANWINAHIYTEKGIDNVYNGEVGELYGTKHIMTQNATVLTNSGSAGTEVYMTFLMGQDFFGVSKLQDLSTWVDAPSKNLVLRHASDVSWKTSFAVKTLNDSFGIRIESGATQ